jgi:hypothetical protein
MKLRRLDKRHSGYGEWEFFINFENYNKEEFFSLRTWCWDTWGPSREMAEYKNACERISPANLPSDINVSWTWTNDSINGSHRRRIYLKSKDEAMLFELSH